MNLKVASAATRPIRSSNRAEVPARLLLFAGMMASALNLVDGYSKVLAVMFCTQRIFKKGMND